MRLKAMRQRAISPRGGVKDPQERDRYRWYLRQLNEAGWPLASLARSHGPTAQAIHQHVRKATPTPGTPAVVPPPPKPTTSTNLSTSRELAALLGREHSLWFRWWLRRACAPVTGPPGERWETAKVVPLLCDPDRPYWGPREEHVERWLASLTNDSTRRRYGQLVVQWLEWIDDHHIDYLAVAHEHGDQWRQDLQSAGLSSDNVALHLNALSSFYRYLHHHAQASAQPRPGGRRTLQLRQNPRRDALVRTLVRWYEDDRLTMSEIGAKAGIAPSTVWRYLRFGGAEIRQQPNRLKVPDTQILDLHEQGLAPEEIACKVGISGTAVRQRLKRRGIQPHRGGGKQRGKYH